MSDPSNDCIRSFLKTIHADRPEIPVASLERIEDEMRRKWGGLQVYVRKTHTDRSDQLRTRDRDRG